MKSTKAALACVVLLGLAGKLHAEGAPAGTVIDNVATVTFELDGNPTSVSSNTATVTVVELVDLSVAIQTAQQLVTAGAVDQALLFRITNTGNGTETFSLAMNSAISGDDFDPIPSSTSIYFDTDGSGDFDAGDQAYVPGTNDPVLAADASVDVFILNDIPAGEANGNTGLSELIVTSTTGTGAPGTNFAGQGDGGVDAIIGPSTGTATVSGEYFVSDVQISITKAQSVSDPFGGSEPVPGATITYTINVQVTGSGIATASVVRDEIPTFTTYVAGSLVLNTVGQTDAADADAGELDTAGVPTIVVDLGNLASADGIQVIEFQVLID